MIESSYKQKHEVNPMSRPEKCRRICSHPQVCHYAPATAPSQGEVVLGFDEYECIRLIDRDGHSQQDCAEKMEVSRSTVARIYENARKKLAQALTEGKSLRIDGGDVLVCTAPRPECEGVTECCHHQAPAAEPTPVPAGEIARVKGLGFLRDKNTTDRFNCRVITRNGKITARESWAIAQAAEQFGSGELAMTTRLTVEIQGIPFRNIEPLRDYLSQYGLETGGTGPKVRPVVSCKGTTCQYGLIDTYDLSEELHRRFYQGYHSVKLPHKFKIAVGGCPNNCVKPDLNDLGIIGQRVVEIDAELCKGCKKCQIESACPVKAASVVEGKICIDPELCNRCGRCLHKCPFKVFETHTTGYRVYIGGRWGKKVARGQALSPIFTDREEVLKLVEKTILLFRDQGLPGERFADTIARLGFENVQAQLLSDDLLLRKDEILSC